MKRWISLCFVVIVVLLFTTVILSGLFYQLDPDELAHAHVVYLLSRGYAPYRDFLMTYTPVFHWVIAPVFWIRGFSISSIESVRFLMVAFFLLRLGMAAVLSSRLFGRTVAGLFLFIILLDPFTVFTGMQIRPDNLMMLLFTASLLTLEYGLRKKHIMSLFVSGILLSLSAIALLKIAPSLIIVWVVLLVHAVRQRTLRFIRPFAAGFFVPGILSAGYFWAQGSIGLMIEQVVVDALAINRAIAYPLPIGNFYLFQPRDVYGAQPAPLWTFAILFPGMAIAGMIVAMRKMNVLKSILIGSLLAQGIALVFVHSLFIQYFLPVSWLFALFTAIVVHKVLTARRVRSVLSIVLVILLLSAGAILTLSSMDINISRSHNRPGLWVNWLTKVWAGVPEGAAVYPNVVFRPIAYPLAFGYYWYDMPTTILSRLPPLTATLDQARVPYIIHTYEWIALPADFSPFVKAKYREISPDIYQRLAL